jgi:tetratricopeptide (TPR) repeat protein/predicted Ser/Thr protein kinase
MHIGSDQLQSDCLTMRTQTEALCRSSYAANLALARDPNGQDPDTAQKVAQFINDKNAQQQTLLRFDAETAAWASSRPQKAADSKSAQSAVDGAQLLPYLDALGNKIALLPDTIKAGLPTDLKTEIPADVQKETADALARTAPSAVKTDANGEVKSDVTSPSAAAGPAAIGDGVKTFTDAALAAIPSPLSAYPQSQITPETQAAQRSLGAGHPAEAAQTLTQELALHPNDPAALSLRAQTRAELGDRSGAAADARRALALNPADKAAKALVAQYDGQDQAQGRIGKGLTSLDFGAAASAGAAGAGLAAGNAAAGGPPSRAAQPAVGAAAVASAAAAVAPFSVRSLLQTAASQLGVGDYSSALLTLQRARNLEPKNASILNLIAKASNEAKNPLGAIAAAEQALKLDPGDASALREKAYAEMTLGQNEQALADAERAIQLDPQNGLGYLYRAMIEEKLGRADEAKRDYASARSLDATLTPLAEEGLKRLGGGEAARGLPLSNRNLFRGGAIAVSTLLIVLGLMGTATGRGLTTKARDLLSGRAHPGAAASGAEAVAATVIPGSFIGGHYRVTRELGRGGMGVVYQAFDETLRRPVAIKQLQREGRGDALELERFLHEARMVAQLRHPHIAEIYSVVGGGDLLLVFEYIEGRSLDAFVGNGRRLPVADAKRLVSEIAGALEYAHGLKIVHRDLKPANVMIAKTGTAKVMDFGIAHQSRSGAASTQTSFVSGTPPYMSPEQMMGSVSPAADVYALGVMTYEMLTGRLPFEGPDYMEQKLGRRYAAASSVEPSLPPAVDALLARALEPEPTKRLSSARDFARGLAEAFGATPSRV